MCRCKGGTSRPVWSRGPIVEASGVTNEIDSVTETTGKATGGKLRTYVPEALIVIVVASIGAVAFFWPSPKDADAGSSGLPADTSWQHADPIEYEPQGWNTATPSNASWPASTDPSLDAQAIQHRLEQLNSLTDTQAQAMEQLLTDLASQRNAQQEQAASINKLSEALTLLAQRPEPSNEAESAQQQEQVVEALYDLKAALDQAQQRTERSEQALIAMTQRLESLEQQAREQAENNESNEADEQTAKTIAELRGQIDSARQDESAQWQSLNQSISALESRLANINQKLEAQPEPTATQQQESTEKTASQPTAPRTRTEIERTNDRHAPILTQVVIKLLNGDYVEATRYFSPEHRQRVTADGIAEAMDGIAWEAGRYAGMVSYQRLPMNLDDGSSVYRVVARTTHNRQVSFTITINREDKVAGLFARIVR